MKLLTINIVCLVLFVFFGGFSLLSAQSAPSGASPQLEATQTLASEALIFENDKIKAKIGVTGLESWLLKKYTEELYTSMARSSVDEKSKWTPTGLMFNSLLPDSKKSSSLTPSGTVQWIESEKCYLSTFTADSSYLSDLFPGAQGQVGTTPVFWVAYSAGIVHDHRTS